MPLPTPRTVTCTGTSGWPSRATGPGSHRDELSAAEAAFLGASQEAERQRKADEAEKARRLAKVERRRAEEAEARKPRRRSRGRTPAETQPQVLDHRRLRRCARPGRRGAVPVGQPGPQQRPHQSRLARLSEAETFTNVGVVALEQGHTFEEMHQFARAVATVAGDPDSERTLGIMNRIRLGVLSRESPRLAAIMEYAGPVYSAAFSPDGTRVVTASNDGTARVWDARTSHPFAELKGHTRPVNSAAFSPDGTRVVTSVERPHGAVLGCSDRPPRRRAERAHRARLLRRVQPGRDPGGHRVVRRHGAGLGPAADGGAAAALPRWVEAVTGTVLEAALSGGSARTSGRSGGGHSRGISAPRPRCSTRPRNRGGYVPGRNHRFRQRRGDP